MRNGIPAAGLSELSYEIRDNPRQGIATYGVAVRWLSGTRAQVSTLPMTIGAHRVNRDFSWMIDEPRQLGGANHAPNPQEYLLSGLGACIMVGFAVGATVMGIQLSTLEIELRSTLDLAGFLDARRGAPVPMTGIEYTVRVDGDGTAEQYERLRQQAEAHSPNAMSMLQGVPLSGRLSLTQAA
ncbi:Predicted redox protein, regulator of disulfide bond formation [Variovorax sp. HW608]|uniref:OsmC family protein n=1 Tax=Variovorax sp. HW608 TaxID=1034889 RepID=UPI00081F82CC|nr:OsmC family protein [Variovorax sp. HW608]SCK30972.1 Predicted redox protein, regulator of disulfide bond formation [Variovorax sp. HW608]